VLFRPKAAPAVGSSPEVGTQIALWIGFALAVGGAIVGLALYALGGARPQTPDLPRFLAGQDPAWSSPQCSRGSVTAGRARQKSPPRARLTMASILPKDSASGPVLFAYDGSELAQLAIQEAARELPPGRKALVLCVWPAADVGFVPVGDHHFDAHNDEVQNAAEHTAAHGATLANNAGFLAESLTIKAAPTWKGIIEVAGEHRVSLIVLGSHRRSGILGHLLGSVTDAVMSHSTISILVVHQRPQE
jgi:nucleotide-binding universal stress UspA family protein